MIKGIEIKQAAHRTGVRDTQIEKDYILTWILAGVAKHPVLSKALVFKGGTVLKKVYFEDYRYSEDLDFTQLDKSIPKEAIFGMFAESFAWIKRKANIDLTITEDDEHESGNINFHIAYTGPLGGAALAKNVKVDITRDEILEFEPVMKDVFIHYSDVEPYQLLCYPLEEVLIEKMCALMGRTQPRDLYDLWYLLEYDKMDIMYSMPEFERKAKNKGHDPATFKEKVTAKFNGFKGRWNATLVHQIKDLEDFDTVVRELGKHFRKI